MAARLAIKDEAGKPSVVRAALNAFVQHGARYCFPASPLNEQIRPGSDSAPVWPWKKGTARGFVFYPLYPSVPEAAALVNRPWPCWSGQLVFVGCALAGVLITDPAHPGCGCDPQRDFQEDSRPGAPLCRRYINDLVLDLMPDVLGTAQPQGLPSGRSIRIVTAQVFLAIKLEECRLSPPALRNDLASQFHELLNTSAFLG